MSEDKPLGRENYDAFADRYAAKVDTKPHNAYLERPATLSLLPDVNGLHILDAGCGPGVYADWLLSHGAAMVVACDVTPQMIEITRERLSEHVGTRLELHVADLNKPLDFVEDATFDLVLCPLVLDYIEDWSLPFGEFARALKPGGVFVFSVGNPATDYFVWNPDGNYFDTELVEAYWGGFGEPKPLVRYYRRSLQSMLMPFINAGFRLDALLEPLPTQAFKEAAPESYQKIITRPVFICIRGIKA